MVSACIFLLLMLGWSAAIPQDMAGKMFTFPQASDTAHVNLTMPKESLEAVTVCIRTFTDISKSHALFSMNTHSNKTEFIVYRGSAVGEFEVNVKQNAVIFRGQQYKENKWQSICSTWDSASGLVQLWINERGSSRKFATISNLNEVVSIVLGQHFYPENFVFTEYFVGMMTDLHMWDYVLPLDQISYYSQRLNFTSGNVVNWRSLEFQIIGRVLIEKEQRLLQN